jgi:valyl-tRNA synthetase
MNEKPKLCKMSKSKGNVITIDEVVQGVYQLADGFEFRDLYGVLVDWQKMCVWRAPEGYRTSTPTGKRPVFLHQVGEPVPPLVLDKVQHEEAINYWANLLELYEDVE